MTTSHFNEINEFLSVADLDDIVVHEERARLIVWDQKEDEEESEAPTPTISLGVNVAGATLRFRFRMVLADKVSEYVADFETIYKVKDIDEITVSGDLQQEFARRVAFMAVYPFLRASIFGGAARLGAPRPVLGLVRQDAFEAGEELTEEAVRAAFFDNRSELNRN